MALTAYRSPRKFFPITFHQKVMMKYKATLTIALAAASSLFAETKGVSLEQSVLPEYPVEARQLNLHGVVVVEALVDETGKVFATDVISSPASQLSTAALEAVGKWVFSPALEEGRPVMQVVRIPIDFNLHDPLRESVAAAGQSAIASR